MIQREYYNLWDAGRIAKCKAKELIHHGANNKLEIYALLGNLPLIRYYPSDGQEKEGDLFPYRTITNGPVRLHTICLAQIEADTMSDCRFVDKVDRGTKAFCTYEIREEKSDRRTTRTIRNTDLVVMHDDLEQFLETSNSGVKAHSTEPTKPLSRAESQSDAILKAIRKLGHDPKKLPKPANGKSGIKAEIRKMLTLHKDIFQSVGVFDDAWQRLRDAGEIAN